jgi:predicted MFS family arabinose efflux permease
VKLSALQQYGIVTANYWAFTLTDGALRMLVVFHFHQLGYTTLEIAFLFLFYEFFGVVTNLYGGWIGARYGLRLTLWVGTLLQILSLVMLIPVAASWPKLLSVVYVMAAQAISGIAKGSQQDERQERDQNRWFLRPRMMLSGAKSNCSSGWRSSRDPRTR